MIILKQTTEEEPPPVEEPPTAHPEFGIGLVWVGTDGIGWDLASGPVFALAGTSGLGAPDVEHWWKETGGFDGAFHQGMRTPPRDVHMPVEVNEGSSERWDATDTEFWEGLDPRGEGKLYAIRPDASSRHLVLRYVSGGDEELDIDPMLMGQSVYPLVMKAGDPFWRGPLITTRFQASNGATFFPGPPFSLEVGNVVTSGTVTNPGEFPAWGKWVLNGPVTAATVGVGSSVITFNDTLLAGEQRIVDMDPRRRSIVDEDGNDAWLEADPITFAAIPNGVDVPLNLDITGAGAGTSIELQFYPRYRRAR